MNVIVVDDEQIILMVETAQVQQLLADAVVMPFSSGEDAINYASENVVDIAFLDINLEDITGIDLAKKLQKTNPQMNIIFCTGYSDYALEALNLYCSGYLMKPVTEEKLKKALSQLRYPLDKNESRIKVQCFGNFEVFCDGAPVKFKYLKTKEMMAYLVHRRGAMVNTNELMTILFEDDDKGSYIRNLKADLLGTFQQLNAEYVFLQDWGKIGIDTSKIECDYYQYLDGKNVKFTGEYMAQFSFTSEKLIAEESSKN